MSTCYYPNGDVSKGGDIPCSGSDACCPLNWTCQSNGLCYLANENYYGRYTCTDKTWQSSGCPNICTHNHTATGNEAVLECSTGNFCCDANRPTLGCCDTSTDRFQLQNIGSGGGQPTSPAKPSSSSAAPTSSSTSSSISSPPSSSSNAVSSSANATPTPRSITLNSGTTSSSSSGVSSATSNSPRVSTLISVITESAGGSSTLVTSSSVATAAPASSAPSPAPAPSKHLGVIIGPVVGGVIGTLLVVVLAFFLLRRRRKQKRASSPPPMRGSLQPMYGDDNKDLVDSPFTGKSELEGSPNMSVVAAGTPAIGNRNANGYHTPDDVGQSGANYRGVPTVPASPTVGSGGARDSKELAASPSTTRSPKSRRSELPGNDVVRDAVGEGGHPVELPASGAYKPYRQPGASGLGVEL